MEMNAQSITQMDPFDTTVCDLDTYPPLETIFDDAKMITIISQDNSNL